MQNNIYSVVMARLKLLYMKRHFFFHLTVKLLSTLMYLKCIWLHFTGGSLDISFATKGLLLNRIYTWYEIVKPIIVSIFFIKIYIIVFTYAKINKWTELNCHDFVSCERFRSMTESKQTALTGLTVASFELITIQSVSQSPSCLSHIFDMCKSKSSNMQSDKSTTQICSRVHSAPSTQRPRHQSTHQSLSCGRSCKLCKKTSSKDQQFWNS